LRNKQKGTKEKVIVSFTQKLGLVGVRSLEEYIKKNKVRKSYVITSTSPHPNVIDYAKKIDLLEIIISSHLKQEVENIRKLYSNNSVTIINLDDDFGERSIMRDGL